MFPKNPYNSQNIQIPFKWIRKKYTKNGKRLQSQRRWADRHQYEVHVENQARYLVHSTCIKVALTKGQHTRVQ